jgi:hypothetical protein
MNPSIILSAALTVPLLLAGASSALADTTEAMCEVAQHGDHKKALSGPCDFSQRQGYVSIALRNGERLELSPTDKPQEFKDQKGNKVVRTSEGSTHKYKWNHQTVLVTFDSGKYASSDRSGYAATLPAMPYSTKQYTATAYFRCSVGSADHDQQCPGGIDRGKHGSATIRIRTPSGFERVLKFEHDNVTTPDRGKVDWSKHGDDFYVGIDNHEFYIVPEAAIHGG